MNWRRTAAWLLSVSLTATASAPISFEHPDGATIPLPAAVRAALLKSEAGKLRDCQQQLGASTAQMDDYFSARSLDLGAGHAPAVLVLPTRDCYAFSGARATSFWLFLNDAPAPRLLLSGRREALQVLDTSSQGLADLQFFYGVKTIRYQYDGSVYNAPDE